MPVGLFVKVNIPDYGPSVTLVYKNELYRDLLWRKLLAFVNAQNRAKSLDFYFDAENKMMD